MVTFKAEVYAHQRKKDGTYNIKIRVTHQGKKRYLSTEWYCTKDDLTRGLRIKNQQYIDFTDDLIRKYRSRCDMAGERLRTMSVDEVVSLITSSSEDEHWDLDFIAYARDYVRELTDTGHEGNAKTYDVAINSLIRFLGRDTMSVREVTVGMLKDWVAWIRKQSTVTTGFAAYNYVSRLRAIHNRAKREFNDEDAGLIRIPNSPFSHIDMPKQPTPEKRAITREQLMRLQSLEDKPSPHAHVNRYNFARDVYLISFYLIGMNEADLWECDTIRDGRLIYQRKKTRQRRSDNAEISVLIQPELKPLLERYKDASGQRVFNFCHLYSSVNSFSRAINIGLKAIGKDIGVDDLEFYSARHTWATLAINEAHVDKYTVHQALGHVDDEMRVTDIYIKKSYNNVDDANRRVLDLLKG